MSWLVDHDDCETIRRAPSTRMVMLQESVRQERSDLLSTVASCVTVRPATRAARSTASAAAADVTTTGRAQRAKSVSIRYDRPTNCLIHSLVDNVSSKNWRQRPVTGRWRQFWPLQLDDYSTIIAAIVPQSLQRRSPRRLQKQLHSLAPCRWNHRHHEYLYDDQYGCN